MRCPHQMQSLPRNQPVLPEKTVTVEVDECNQLVRDGSLGTLVRAFRTPDEQHSRWQEAAYYNWIARGRPIGDDLRDWLDAEPLA